ncbi:hypothetical protein RB653_008496 [Dictyostelium firmibasis]|uniref:Peptidase S9 prolyl oligopeptidase catalytic domain-containing protein n=1 Tax=Dictyostelium firmibasis TaxID=79012 RepID=A0AAN7UCN7_9MYCE
MKTFDFFIYFCLFFFFLIFVIFGDHKKQNSNNNILIMNDTNKNLISVDLVVNNKDSRYLESFKPSNNDFSLFFEMIPEEQARSTLIQIDNNGNRIDLIPKEFNIISSIIEYGGNSITIINEPKSNNDEEFLILFSECDTQELYLYHPFKVNDKPKKLTFKKNNNTDSTNGGNKLRFSSGTVDKANEKVIMVCEDHTDEKVVLHYLVEINLKSNEIETIEKGNDFYSYPKFYEYKNELLLAYVFWNFPNMPWDNSNVCIKNLKTNETINISQGYEESVLNPIWSEFDDCLYFISDLNGYWTIHKYDLKTKQRSQVIESELINFKEIGEPMWYFGRSYYGFIAPTKLIASLADYGLVIFNIETNQVEQIIRNQFSHVKSIVASPSLSTALFIGGSPTVMFSPIKLTYDNQSKVCEFKQLLKVKGGESINESMISVPIEIEFNTSSKSDGLIEKAFAFYYPPSNTATNSSMLPPLLVKSHGGPTDRAYSVLNFEYQYWTSRGFAILDVNYRGSSGFGKRYRKLLNRNWGLYDNADLVNGALHIVNMGLAHRDKLFIDGGSAGGYATLCSLTFYDIFKGGCSYYGVADLETLFKETHKFESRYQDILITEMKLDEPNGEWKRIYRDRSPIYHLDLLKSPIALFHGLEDHVVPYNQSVFMYDHLKSKGLPSIIELFTGEGHGFLSKDNIIKCLEYEYIFFCKLLNQLPIGIKYHNNNTILS